MNDNIFSTAKVIKNNSKEDSIINVWWDNGYIYEYFAQRQVLMGGGSFSTPHVYWFSTALTTQDENLSKSILRMLDCGNPYQVSYLTELKIHPSQSTDIIKKILLLNKTDAKQFVENLSINPSILDHTHCQPKESFLIISYDLLFKNSILHYYSDWDFYKSALYLEIKNKNQLEATNLLKERHNLNDSEIDDIFKWIPYKNDVKRIPEIETIDCEMINYSFYLCNDVNIDLDSKTAYKDKQYRELIIENQSFIHNNSIDKTVIFLKDFIVIAKEDSMLLKLMFPHGNINNFELNSSFGDRMNKIISYKIKW